MHALAGIDHGHMLSRSLQEEVDILLQAEACDFGFPAPDFDLKTPQERRQTRECITVGMGMFFAYICSHCRYTVGVIEGAAPDLKAPDVTRAAQWICSPPRRCA